MFCNAFVKQIKWIEDQREKQMKAPKEHEKHLVKYYNEEETSTHSKQKEIFEELDNERMEENQLILIIKLIVLRVIMIQNLL